MNLPLPVVLSGGLGTRLGTLTEGLPKSMVEVAGRPFLEHILSGLAAQGFREAMLLVGHRAEVIQERFGDGSGLGLYIHYSCEPEPLGTGGAFHLARPRITTRFLLLYGDLYRPTDYAALAQAYQGNALGVYPFTPGLSTIDFANVGLDPSGHRVAAYAKDRPDLGLTHVDAGFGLFEPEVLDLLPEGRSSFEAEIYPGLAARGGLEAILVDRSFFDIGNPSDLEYARQWLPRMLEP